MIRLYLTDSATLSAGLEMALPPEQGRYLAAVMRKAAGDEIRVFNGRDGEWTARITETSKKAVRIELTEQTRPQPEGQGPTLLVALVKRNRLETIIEKATELGASKIQLLITHRSNADHTNVDRLRLIAQEAAEQTERLDVPEVLQPLKLEKLLEHMVMRSSSGLDRHSAVAREYDAVYFGDEDSTHLDDKQTRPMLEVVKPGPAAILIGPEGGFDATERQILRSLPNVHPVNLGPRILRADTAAISALTLYQAAAGDWR
ncbi:MAG TPA: 16S rRNA (uracil(1498)-N(3))-methyltransferase [Asticcacaulis sp.]|nr:16S rRNA (uracil(1498)-N(3))-methyltransferase [Asticcacaulis sp.]